MHQGATRQELEQRTGWWRLVLHAWRLPCQGAAAHAKHSSVPLSTAKQAVKGRRGGGGQGIDTKVSSLDLRVSSYPSSCSSDWEGSRYPPQSTMPLTPEAESGWRKWESATVLQEKWGLRAMKGQRGQKTNLLRRKGCQEKD